MSQLVLVTGGCRSGKSDFALRLAAELAAGSPAPPVFLATCLPADAEMQERVALHRAQRPAHWNTLEEAWDLPGALARVTAEILVIDCLPTWLGNLLVRGDNAASIRRQLQLLGEALASARASHVVMVTAEVGSALVPETALGRLFRDLVGEANQFLGRQAQALYWLVAGYAVPVPQVAVTASQAARTLRSTHSAGSGRT